MVDARNFLLNTDYPMDKVIYKTSSSVTPTGASTDVTIVHELGFMPLPIVQWSFNADFSVARETTERPSELYPPSFPYVCYVEANSTNIKLGFTDFTGGTPATIYYRVFCFMPSDVNVDIAPLSDTADNFVLNTDYNYTKLFMSGIANENAVITHSLGYIPQVLIWAEIDSGIYTQIYYGYGVYGGGLEFTPEVTTTTLILPDINIVGLTIKRFHYRIYLDE